MRTIYSAERFPILLYSDMLCVCLQHRVAWYGKYFPYSSHLGIYVRMVKTQIHMNISDREFALTCTFSWNVKNSTTEHKRIYLLIVNGYILYYTSITGISNSRKVYKMSLLIHYLQGQFHERQDLSIPIILHHEKYLYLIHL